MTYIYSRYDLHILKICWLNLIAYFFKPCFYMFHSGSPRSNFEGFHTVAVNERLKVGDMRENTFYLFCWRREINFYARIVAHKVYKLLRSMTNNENPRKHCLPVSLGECLYSFRQLRMCDASRQTDGELGVCHSSIELFVREEEFLAYFC